MLPQEAVNQFREIYFEEMGESLPNEEATDAANRFVSLMSVLYRPILEAHVKKQRETPNSDRVGGLNE